MKKALLGLLILSFAVATMLAQSEKKTAPPAEKKLTVELTLAEWGRKLDFIEFTKGELKKSNLPANEVLPLIDSLSKIQNDIVVQLQPQVAPPVTDSVKQKKK